MMRRFVTGFSIAGAMAVSAAAAPPQPPATGATRSVADYLCAFAGKCEGDAPAADVTMAAPETRGFSLARPTAAAPARPTAPRAPQRIVIAPAPVPAARAPRPHSRLAARTRVRAPAAVAAPVTMRFDYPGAPPSVMAPRVDLLLSFKKNSAELTDQARKEAEVFAQSLLVPELRSKRFTIEGHTDSAGGRAYNLALSQRRARAVAAFLTSQGVESSRLQVRGMAFDAPRPGKTADSPDNRRVEAVLTS